MKTPNQREVLPLEVHIAFGGSYDETHPIGVFTDKSEAEALTDQVYTFTVDKKPGKMLYRVEKKREDSPYEAECCGIPDKRMKSDERLPGNRYGHCAYVLSTTKAHALKKALRMFPKDSGEKNPFMKKRKR